jgi:4-amino-4-deoxy-L-arabinose transferase-like glycosyltransferase
VLERNPDKKKLIYIGLLLILGFSCVFFFLNLGTYSLKEPDEGRYAEIPREMVEQGDYLVPHLNYVRYFEKPPLLYWLTAGSYKVFGVSEWSFRFPNALAALLCVLTIFFFASRWLTKRTAIISSLLLITSFGFFALARIVTIDMLLTFLLFASLSCFYEYYRERRSVFLYLFFVFLALAVLAKGPVAIILLGATILLFLFLEKKLPFVKRLFSFKGLFVFAVIAAPWFVLISLREKEFFYFFFIDQHFLRFLTTKHHRSGPIYYFLPVLFGGLFPWSVFIPRAVLRFWRLPEMRLFLLWSLVVFVFFSVSGSKLPPYILPVFPAMAVVLGTLFERDWREHIQRKREIIVYAVLFSCIMVGGVAFGFGFLDRYLKDLASLSRDIRGLVFGISSVSLAILVLLGFRRIRTFGSLFLMLNAFSVAVALGLMLHAHVIDRFNTTKELARAINERGRNTTAVSYRSFDETLPFYLKRRTYLAGTTGELEMGAKYPEAGSFFLSQEELLWMFQSDKPVLAVMKTKRLKVLNEPGFKDAVILKCQDTRCLIANPAARVNGTQGER